jgi:gamma-glutamyltranspeptidase/glutathione hydrolase
MIFDEALRHGESVAPPRDPVFGRAGIAATAHPLVSLTAVDIIRRGGTAVDAAIAGGAMLMVVEPRNGHPGGDLFMQVDAGNGDVVAINGSGAAPAQATAEHYRELGGIPEHGLLSAAVPGVIAGWKEAHARWGKLPLNDCLSPAIAAAREGVPVTPRFHKLLETDAPVYAQYPASARVFLPDGKVPEAGSTLAQPLLARTLERLAENGLDDFYRGALAEELVAFSRANGGLFAREDFSEHRSEVRSPVTIRYRGFEVSQQPPVSQGITVLLALRILERFELARFAYDSPERVHLIAEAYSLAYEERLRTLGDPRFVTFDEAAFLSDDLTERLAARIDLRRSLAIAASVADHPDTTFAAYAAGPMTVAYIHSLYSGSGVVMGETGALMNSRLRSFSLDAASPNVLAPRKRPVHTLNTWLIRRDGKTLFAGGTPGAQWQVQTNLQIVTNLIDYGMDLVDAQNAPRFTIGSQLADPDRTIKLESRAGAHVFEGLRDRGYPVEVIGPWDAGGAVQLIARDARTGMLRGATEVRRPGCTVLGV